MKPLMVLLFLTSALLALDDPTYPIHENGEYLCYKETPNGLKCELWLFGKRIRDDMVEAYKIRRYGRYLGGATATIGGKPKGEYEKEPVVLNLNQFNYVKLMRIKRDIRTPDSGESSLRDWADDKNFSFAKTNKEATP